MSFLNNFKITHISTECHVDYNIMNLYYFDKQRAIYGTRPRLVDTKQIFDFTTVRIEGDNYYFIDEDFNIALSFYILDVNSKNTNLSKLILLQ